MLQPLQQSRRAKRRVDQIKAVPAPVLGWVSGNEIEVNAPGTATILDNWVPTRNSIVARNGCANVSNLPSYCFTLMNYVNGTVDELLGATVNTIYRVPSSYSPGVSPVAPTLIQAGFTGGQWNHVQFANAADVQALLMVNGLDGLWRYTGGAITKLLPTTTSSGLYTDITSYKGRIWVIEKGSLLAYYGDPLSNSPATLTAFPIGPFVKEGSYLVSVDSWTRDGGSGPDDYLVFCTNNGEIVVYTGNDPGSDFNLVGVFKTAEPLGRRCFKKAAGDLLYYSTFGPMKLSEMLPAFAGQNLNEVKIRPEFENYSGLNKASFGWELLPYAKKSWVIYNVPVSPPLIMHQYIQNVDTGAWFRFTGWNAQTWCECSKNLYYGDSEGKVFIADFGQSDDGNNIPCDFMAGWWDFNIADNKKFNVIEFTVRSDVIPSMALDMMTDYQTATPQSTPGFAGSIVETPWNTSPWNTSLWSGSSRRYVNRSGLGGIGGVGALRYRTDILNNSHELFGYRIGFEVGDFL